MSPHRKGRGAYCFWCRSCWCWHWHLFAPHFMMGLPEFNQICTDITFGHGQELIRFCDLDLIFKVTAWLKLPNLSQKVLVCRIFHEPIGRFWLDIYAYNVRTWSWVEYVLVTFALFSRSLQGLTCQIYAKSCLYTQYLMRLLADFNQICMYIL